MFSSRCRFNRETVSSELTGSLLIRVNETDWTAGNWETLLMTHWRAEGEQRSSTCSKHWQRCAQDLRPEKSSQGKGSKGLPTRDQLVYILPLIITHVDKIHSSNYYYYYFFQIACRGNAGAQTRVPSSDDGGFLAVRGQILSHHPALY